MYYVMYYVLCYCILLILFSFNGNYYYSTNNDKK